MALEPEDRTEELVGTSKAPIPFTQSTAQMPRKTAGRARLVVEYFFDFAPEFLTKHGCKDGVEYLRRVADDLEASSITIHDVEAIVRAHGDLDWRIEVSK